MAVTAGVLAFVLDTSEAGSVLILTAAGFASSMSTSMAAAGAWWRAGVPAEDDSLFALAADEAATLF